MRRAAVFFCPYVTIHLSGDSRCNDPRVWWVGSFLRCPAEPWLLLDQPPARRAPDDLRDLIGAWTNLDKGVSAGGFAPKTNDEEVVGMVIIGVDAHMRTHTFVAVDELGRRLAERRLSATSEGHLDALECAAR